MPKQDYLDRINNKSSADAYKTRIKQKNAQNVYEQISRDMGNLSSITGSLYNDTYNRYKDGNDTYRADSKNWLNRTTADSTRFQASSSEISSLLDEYDGILDPEWSANVRKAMDSYSEGIKKITESAQQEDGFWSNFKDEAEYTDYRNKATADLDALGREIDDLEATYQKANEYAHGRVNQTYWAKLLTDKGYSGDTEGLNKLQADIAEKKAFRNSASVYQGKGESADLARLVEEARQNPDFAKYSAEGANIENPSYNEAQPSSIFRRSQEVNNPVTFSRENTDAYAISGGQYAPKAYNHDYQFMTEDEVDAYNYYLAAEKAGLVEAGTADNFLKEAEEVLNQRSAEDLIKRTPNNLLGDLLVGMYAGGEQFTSGIEGIKRFITDSGEYAEAAPISKGEFALSAWEQNLPDNGWGKVRKGVADLTSTITNQIPSIMTSTILSAVASPAVGETVGAALMGAGAAGNAYNEFVRQGYSTKQARLYGTLIGISETCLEKAVGGISAFGAGGAKISDRIVEQICKGVSSANARIAIQFGGHVAAEMLSEGIEEFTQDVLEPYFQALVKGGKPEAVDWEQAAYSGLLGALSAGLMNGVPGTIKTVETVSNARNINGTSLKNLVIENFSEDSLARQYAMELGDNPTTRQKAKLLYEVENGFEGDLVSDLERELMNQGVDRATAHKQAQDIGSALTSGRDITLPDEETANAVDALSTSILARLSARNSIGELTFAGSIDAKTIAPRILELTKPTDTAFDIANTIRKQGATVSDEFANDIKQNLVNVGVMEADAETMVNEFRKASVSDTDVNKDALSVPDLLDRAVMDALVGNITESERIKADIDKTESANENADIITPTNTNEEAVAPTTDEYTKDEAGLTNLLKKLNINADESSFRYDTLSGDEAKAYLRGLENAYTLAYSDVDPTKSNFAFKERLTDSEVETMKRFGKEAGAKVAKESKQDVSKRKGSVRGYNLSVKELREGFNENQKFAMRIITAVAQAKGINVVLFDSSKGDVPPELVKSNGAYSASRRTIYLDVSAGVNVKNDFGNLANYTLLQTFSHEFVHALENDSPTEYREFRQFIFDKMTERGQNVNYLVVQKQAKYGDLEYDDASREVVAESMVNIFSDEKVVKDLYDNHLNIFKKILKALQDFVDDLKAYFERTFKHGNTVEAQAVMDGINYVDGVADAFIKLMNAKPQLQEELTKNTPAEKTEATTSAIEGTQDGIPQSNAFTETLRGDMQFQRFAEYNYQPKVAMGLDGTSQSIVTTLPDGTKATNINGGINSVAAFTNRQVREAVMKVNGYSKEQIKRVNDFMDAMDKFLEKMGIQYKFVGLDDVEKARLSYKYDENGNVIGVVLSAMVKNGDYPVNFDLTSICKKRTAVSQLIGKLASAIDENNKSVNLTPKNLFKINEALKEAGYETACLGCFVESKRYNVMNWARKICERWNNAVLEVNPDATYFDYSNGNEDEITSDRIDAFEKARRKYANMPKSKSMEEALAKFQKKADEGKPLIKAYKVETEDGVIENTFSKTARGKIEKSDILTEEQKDYFLSMDVNDLEVSDVEVLMNAGIVSGGGLSSEQVIKNLVNSGEIYQHLLRPSDLLTAKGMAQLNKLPNFYGTMYRQYGSATPKPIQGFTPYNSEIALLPDTKGNMSLAEYLYNIAGVRMQSFSDFQIQNIYDYLQMVGDLAARKLTAHAYTKEISFARLLGMTGVKTNLSVMFDIDASLVEKVGIKVARDHAGLTLYDPNVHTGEYGRIVLEDEYGKWVYNIGDYAMQKAYKNAYPERARRFVQSIGFAEAVALQTSPGYTKNCGIIGVGMSRLGIMAMLDDNRIRYIIPYHSSSLPKVIKTATNIEYATDFTPWQNTVKIKSITDNEGNEVSWSVKEAVARLGGADAAIRELNEKILNGEWKVKTGKATTGHGSFALYEDLAKTSDPRKTASNYIEWCASNNTLPVFYEYANHNNFYKLLYDFNVYDTVTEEYAPLEAVQNIYPTMKGDQVVPQNLVDGDFDTSYMEKTIEDQMRFMDDFNRRQDLATTNLAENIANRNRYEITLPKDLKHQFAGEKALTADKDALAKAKQMEEEGKTSEEIRQETGWFKSYDGKWRFEIDNSKAEMVDTLDKFGKVKEPAFPDEPPTREIEYPIRTKLGDILKHSALFKAYPRLKNIPVNIDVNDSRGAFMGKAGSTDGKVINLYMGDDPNPIGTLLHEVQHIVQGIEGFAKGSSPNDFRANPTADVTTAEKEYREAEKKLASVAPDFKDARLYEYLNQQKRKDKGATLEYDLTRIKEIENNAEEGGYLAELKALLKASQDLEVARAEASNKDNPYVMYGRTAGEIEARDVENRREYTPEKRKATRPDIDRDDAIVKLQYQKKDAEYLELAKDPEKNEAKLSKMVEEAARANGYDSPKLYHGTTQFGWTKPMLQTGKHTRGSEIGLWTADDPQSVVYYSGENADVRKIGLGNTEEEIEETREWNKLWGKEDDGNVLADGIYQLYGNTDGFLYVKPENKGANFLNIVFEGKKYNTIEMAQYAKEHGYSGLQIDGVLDGNVWSNEYVFFNPQSQVKSADPVTYDADGNVILLSERFNSSNNDLRYQRKVTPEEDAEYLEMAKKPEKNKKKLERMVEQAAIQAFPNSRLIDDGKFRKMWHFTKNDFTSFLPGTSPDPNGIKGIYFAPTDNGSISSRLGTGKAYYLNVTNPAVATKGNEDVAKLREMQKGVESREEIAEVNKQFIQETGIDAIVDWMNGWYTVLSPEQIKSADPVTYDSDGNVIPLSERFNSANNDLRYQLRQVEEISFDDYEKMEKHFGTTNNFNVAGYLLRDGKMLDFSGKHWGDKYSTFRQVDHRDIQEYLEGRGNNGVNAMIDMLANGNIRLAPEMGGINLAVKPNGYQTNVLRGYITKFRGEVMVDIDEVGGDTIHSFSYPRGTSADKVLNDINAYFDRGVIPNQESVVSRFHIPDFEFQRRNDWRLGDWEILSRAAENLEGNNYTDEQKKALTFFQSRLNALHILQEKSDDLWEQYLTQRKTDRKAADKTLAQRRTIKLKIEQAAEEVTKATEPKVVRDLLKEARDVIETQEREHGAEVLRRYRDRRDNSEAIAKYKKRVLKDSHELQKWITNPDDKAAKRVPDVIKNSVIDFLSLINETSTSALKGKAATQADYKFAERLRKLRDAIKTQAKDLDGLYSGYTDLPEDFFDEMEYFINMVGSLTNHTDEFVINAMTSDELKRLSATITAIKHYVQLMNAFQANAIYQHVFDAGDDTISYLEQMKKAGFTERGIFNYFTWTQMRPAYAWARFGKGGEAIFDELRRAQGTLAFNAAEIIEFTKKLYTDKEVNEWTKETKTFDINGDKVEVPVSFIMSLYELMKQEDSRRHIETNGLRFAAYSKGARKIADEGHVATYDKVMEIIDSLTDRQKEVADGLQRFMATRGAEWGNYVSMKRFGREAFSNLRYFPISSDGRYLESSGEEKPNNASLYALLNMSFTKARNPHANNRLVVYDIFDVFANHMASMAQYNSFALPILDALKWLNYSTTDMQGNPLSIKDEMARVYGTPTEGRPGKGSAGYAERFVTNILKAFNGTETQANPTDNVGLNLLRRYNQAQIAYNLRVVVQQPMAIVRAASILPGVTLAKGALKNLKTLKANIEEMQKYSGIAKLKSLGYYDTNVSPGLTKQIKHDENFLDKAGDIGMKPAEFADDVTWAAIWVASKEQAKGDLEKAVEIFEDVIYKTQVVDSVLTKTEFMRNKGGIARILSSFMSEPVTTASMMVNAIEQFNRDRKSGMSQQELWKRHGKNFARVTAVYAVNAIVLAVAEAAMDALRDDSDDPYLEKYGEKFWQNFLDEISPFAKYPIIKDVEEGAKAIAKVFADLAAKKQPQKKKKIEEFERLFGMDYGYSPRTITGQGLDQFLKGMQIVVDKYGGQKKGYTWYAGIYKLLQGLSGLTGTHFGTITREVITTWNTLVGGMNPSLKVRSYVSNDDLSGMIVRAAQKGDSEALESLRDKYYKNEDDFKSAYRNAIGDAYIKGEISAEEASKLLERYYGADDAHWQIDRWNYKAENGTTDGYKKYNDFFTAVETGQNLKAVIKEYTDNGVDKKTLASQITSHFKPIYTQASKAEKARLKGYLLNAYEMLGYNRKQKSKDIDAWG